MKTHHYTRRDMLKAALGTLPMACLVGTPLSPLSVLSAAETAKPNSLINGVQIGIIAPYSFHGLPSSAEALLQYIVELGISAVELQNDPVEQFAGAPAGRRGEELTKWRATTSMDRFKALRKLYNDAGVRIYGFKLDLRLSSPESEYVYAFNACEALGANQLTMELPRDAATTKRIGEYAAQRKIWAGYHAHTQAHLHAWDMAFSQSPYNGANIDIGHYVAGTSESPIPFIEKNHARITSMHLKDRKKMNGPNAPWGQGDTPIKEVLQLMKKEKYTFPATIELEYDTPAGSNVKAELAKCLQYCREALA